MSCSGYVVWPPDALYRSPCCEHPLLGVNLCVILKIAWTSFAQALFLCIAACLAAFDSEGMQVGYLLQLLFRNYRIFML